MPNYVGKDGVNYTAKRIYRGGSLITRLVTRKWVNYNGVNRIVHKSTIKDDEILALYIRYRTYLMDSNRNDVTTGGSTTVSGNTATVISDGGGVSAEIDAELRLRTTLTAGYDIYGDMYLSDVKRLIDELNFPSININITAKLNWSGYGNTYACDCVQKIFDGSLSGTSHTRTVSYTIPADYTDDLRIMAKSDNYAKTSIKINSCTIGGRDLPIIWEER